MSDPNEAWREAQRRRWLRPNGQLYVRGDAYRFAAPGTPEAKMPGWLDPSMTRVRWKEAQEEAARQLEAERQEELERDLLELRWLVKSLRTDLLLRDLRHKYDPTQPRVPAGNPQGGQWTSVTGSVGDAAAAADGSGDDSAGPTEMPGTPRKAMRPAQTRPRSVRTDGAGTTTQPARISCAGPT